MKKIFHRGLWLAAGIFFLLLAAVGLLLPVIPQLPFFLAALLCFMRGSNRFSNWVKQKKWFIRLKEKFRRP